MFITLEEIERNYEKYIKLKEPNRTENLAFLMTQLEKFFNVPKMS